MIPKLWLAAFLGVLLGVGMAYATSVPAAPAANMRLTAQTFEVAPQTAATGRPIQSSSQLALLSLMAGLIVATPAFLIAKRRN